MLFRLFLVFLMVAVLITLVVGAAKRFGLPTLPALLLVPVIALLGWLLYKRKAP